VNVDPFGRMAPARGPELLGFGRPAGVRRLAALALLAATFACSPSQTPTPSSGESPSPSQDAFSVADRGAGGDSSQAAREQGPLVMFLGDSLTAGLGLAEGDAYPALVAEELARRGLPVRAVNAGVSGDTSAGGLARIDWLLRQRPDLVLVELGANDGLRGQPVASIESNLRGIVERCRTAGARVVLVGMKMPPNYGPAYTSQFEAIYPRLARELDLPFLPFLLEGVAADPALNLPDGLHPNAEGHRRIAVLVADALEPVLRELTRSAPAAR